MRHEALADALDATDAPSQSGLSPSVAQRRSNQRFLVDLDVSLGSDRNVYAGLAENLSLEGVFVATHRLQAIGENVEICIHLPGGPEIRGIGTVRWVRHYDELRATPPGMGVRFVELEPESLREIQAFLAGRESVFYDGG